MPAKKPAAKGGDPGGKDWKEGTDCSVKVYLRVRPFNNKEKKEMGVGIDQSPGASTEASAVGDTTADLASRSIVLCRGPTSVVLQKNAAPEGMKPSDTSGLFHFDKVFNSVVPKEGTQEEIFQCIGPDLLDAAMCGYNVCLMAYGQTSSGKTFTMTGGDLYKDPVKRGVIPRFLDGLFSRMQAKETTNDNIHFKLEAGYMEVYNEQVKDLLNPKRGKKLQVREHPVNGPFAEGLVLKPILNPAAIINLLDTGNKARHVRATNMNDVSSRSHAILQLILTQYITEEIEGEDEPVTSTVVSKMNLVDLAGSERQKASGVEGEGKKEAISINTALHCLRKVIDALTAKKAPPAAGALRALQRESILTWLLADSFGGNSKTCLIATASPAPVNYAETASTLRYASAAREIENVVKINSDGQSAVIAALEDEIQRLMAELDKAAKRSAQKEVERQAEEQEKLLSLLESNEQIYSEERSELQLKIDDLEQSRVRLRQELTEAGEEARDVEQRYRKQLGLVQQQLKAAHQEQSQTVKHQNQLSVEIIEMRNEAEGAKQQVIEMERKYNSNLERMVKGHARWETLLKEATKPVKGKGGGAGDSTVAQLCFSRLQNETLNETLLTMNEALDAAYKENARLVSVVSSAMSQIADYENHRLNEEDKDATIRRLQQVLEVSNQKEEKYLGQLRDLSLDHLMLKQRYQELRGAAGAASMGDVSDISKSLELPEELRMTCSHFGFRDPVSFSKWVVKTLGPLASQPSKNRAKDLKALQALALRAGASDVDKTDHSLTSEGAFSLRSTTYLTPAQLKELTEQKEPPKKSKRSFLGRKAVDAE